MTNVAALHATAAEAADLRAKIAALQGQDPKLTQAEIVRQSGISSSRISQYLKGIYTGDVANLEMELARWVDSYESRQRQARAMPVAPGYVATPSGERATATFGYAQVAGDLVVIYGGAGTGKTAAANQYQRTNPNVWVATMTPATATVVPALEEVADALGMKEIVGGGAKIQRAIIRRLAGTQGLLIIDEAQHLGVQALDALRALHDATGLGLALVGNETVYARMTGGTGASRAAYLDRLFSRVGKRVRLLKPLVADIDALIDAWGVEAKACRQVLHEIAAKPGGLRGLTKVLRLASMFANGSNRGIECDDIRAAWRDLGGE